jgi:hypothetical protein
MKMTLLEMTRNILAALDEDDVDNIDDTPSAQQITETLKEVYYQLVENEPVPELMQLIRLSAAPGGENALLTIPTTIGELHWIKYNKIKTGETRPNFQEVCYMTPEEFIQRSDSLDATQSNVETMTDPTSAAVTVYIENDKAPSYWTSFDDRYIIFNSYDIAVDASGISATKTKCYGQAIPTWTASNSFTPTLDANKFAYLLAEAKATCFANLKSEENPKIERQARQQKAKQQNNAYRMKRPEYKISPPNYGRK